MNTTKLPTERSASTSKGKYRPTWDAASKCRVKCGASRAQFPLSRWTAVKRKTRLGLLFMIVVMGFGLLGGCALTSGRKISAEQVSQISEGTTTKAQVELLFGKPKSKSVTSGNETWIYHHASEKYIPGSLGRGRYDQHGQTLMITFKSDIVVHYTFTTT